MLHTIEIVIGAGPHSFWYTHLLGCSVSGVSTEEMQEESSGKSKTWQVPKVSTETLRGACPLIVGCWLFQVISRCSYMVSKLFVYLHPDPWVNDENDLTTSSCDDEFLKSLNRNPLKRWNYDLT